MKFTKKPAIIAAIALAAGLALTGCASDADRASENLSKAADSFEVERRVVFLNVESGKYELSIEGRCSIRDDGNQLEVTCKVGPDAYKKHFLGKAQDFTYFAEQLESVDVSVYHYRVIFKPENIIPNIDVQTGKQ